MRLQSILSGLLAVAVSGVYSTALTYKLAANEKACFFTDVQRQGAKVAFYFAVRRERTTLLSLVSYSTNHVY